MVHTGDAPRFEIDRFNLAYEDQTGLSLEDARGLTPREWLGDDVGSTLEEKYHECLETQARLRYEERLEFPSGTEIWETTLTPVLVDGEVSQLVGTTREVTDRRRARRERTRSRDLLRHTEALANTGGWELDVRTDALRWTRGTRRIFGVSASFEPTLEDALAFYHPDDRDAIRDAIDRCRTDGVPYDLEARIVRADGPERWVRSRGAAVVEDGAVHTLRGAVQDVTRTRRQERELGRQNERLAAFSRVVSHDLRNPLNVAQGALSVVETDSEHDDLEQIAAALDRMETIVDETLALAREGQAVADVEWVDVEPIVDDCWQLVDTTAATLELEVDGRIRADADRLRHVYENLFRNAVEHSSTSPRSHARGDDSAGVTVRVGTLEDGFFVEDDGPGIPAAEREAIFEPGYTTGDGNTGFGLPIVRRIADAHGWTVTVTDGPAGGARFEFSGVELENG
nr:ATP-binding protein [Natronobeatus ordinarius]